MAKKIFVYHIDSDVPVPEETGPTLPPIRQLEPGESILFSIDKRSSVQSIASKMKREEGKVFTIQRIDEDNARIWRVK